MSFKSPVKSGSSSSLSRSSIAVLSNISAAYSADWGLISPGHEGWRTCSLKLRLFNKNQDAYGGG